MFAERDNVFGEHGAIRENLTTGITLASGRQTWKMSPEKGEKSSHKYW